MLVFAVITAVILASAAMAMTLRNLIHSALLLTVNWVGIAAFYLWAGAEFVAFAQVLVYVGAVSMIVLFAVLLTRPRVEPDAALEPATMARAAAGVIAAAVVAGVLCGAVVATDLSLDAPVAPAPALTVRQVGEHLMGEHGVAALLVVGVLLTVALIGAIVVAAPPRTEGRE